jgi:uncharacterized protein YgbK (DUF1537 family)
MDDSIDAGSLTEWAIAAKGAPLIYSSADPSVVRMAQETHGRDAVAHKIEDLFTVLTARLVENGFKRLVVAGGETSGAVITGLDAVALRIGPKLAAGVPVMLEENRKIAIALKSGNFGGPNFFTESLKMMEQSQ